MAATVTLPDLSLRGGRAAIPGGMAWGAQDLVLRLSARHPYMLRIEATGAQHLRVSDGPDIAYTARLLFMVVPLQAGPSAPPLALQGEALRVGLAGGSGSPLTIAHLTADAVLDAAAMRGKPAAVLRVTARTVGLPNQMVGALGDRMESLQPGRRVEWSAAGGHGSDRGRNGMARRRRDGGDPPYRDTMGTTGTVGGWLRAPGCAVAARGQCRGTGDGLWPHAGRSGAARRDEPHGRGGGNCVAVADGRHAGGWRTGCGGCAADAAGRCVVHAARAIAACAGAGLGAALMIICCP